MTEEKEKKRLTETVKGPAEEFKDSQITTVRMLPALAL